jgi:hypothetical protein
MNRVKILKDAIAYPDGVRPVMYRQDHFVEVNDMALKQLIDQGAVVIVDDKAIHAAPEVKPVRGRRRAV